MVQKVYAENNNETPVPVPAPAPAPLSPSRHPDPPASEFGSPLEVEKNGMLRASFGEDGKVDELEMMFDGVAVHQQLQRAIGGEVEVTKREKLG